METQPQLLLLQKTMLTAEGTGRKLNPEANMWMMSKPLIEDWMVNNLGPEALLIEGAQDIAQIVRRLPRLLEKLDKGTEDLAEGRLSLHQETIRIIKGESRFDFVFFLLIAVGMILGGFLTTFLF
jgi:ubiquinone biosynthesis protein